MDQITDRLAAFMHVTPPTAPERPLDHRAAQSDQPQGLQADVVTLSDEGKAKAQSETNATPRWEFLNKVGTEEDPINQKKGDPLDRAIEEIKDKIRELEEQIERLSDQNSESAQKQLEALDQEMMLLQGQLMALTTKKLENLKNARE
jgi:hypothetical protein